MNYILIGLAVYLIGFGFLIRFVQVVRQRDNFMHDAHDRWVTDHNESPTAREAS
jgi:hypothetical protein